MEQFKIKNISLVKMASRIDGLAWTHEAIHRRHWGWLRILWIGEESKLSYKFFGCMPFARKGWTSKEMKWMEKIKRLRARDGCLGTCWRRRTDRPRKITVSCQKSVDPWVSEWGNPIEVMFYYFSSSKVGEESIRRELKHLSTSRKRNQARDTLSSGERNG